MPLFSVYSSKNCRKHLFFALMGDKNDKGSIFSDFFHRGWRVWSEIKSLNAKWADFVNILSFLPSNLIEKIRFNSEALSWENKRNSDVYRGYRKRPVTWNWLSTQLFALEEEPDLTTVINKSPNCRFFYFLDHNESD